MNVLFIKKLYSPVGGSEALTYQLATRLAARGHRVRVVSLWPRAQRYGFPPAADLVRSARNHRLYLNAGVEVYQLRPRMGALGQALDVMAPFRLLRREIARDLARGFDLVHNVCREYAADALAIARAADIPYITTPLAHPGQAWGGDSRADLGIYRQADAIVALTEAERAWYIRHGAPPSRVVAIGLGPTFEQPGDGVAFRRRYSIKGPLILFVGRKERYKGVPMMVTAAPKVWRRHPEATFAFIGEHSVLRLFDDPFRGKHDRRLLDLPPLENGEKADAFAACDVFCLPSRYETFGLVFAEAWLCGKPVLGGDIPPLRDVITDGRDGFVVSQSPREIADALNRLLDDPEMARQMGAAGRRKVDEHYNWNCTVDQTEYLYASLVERRAADLQLTACE
ncbi:MAG: glycosyltransferase family 4 protein [Chloroflexota bacterium]